jgi:hypothetical protein
VSAARCRPPTCAWPGRRSRPGRNAGPR